ncbi:hypothetical protein GJ496_009883 [Pomphorhynchus laevis]|nr:hypothetical protein GJ496_009883 [Pomphorhynchus laevis]
MTNKRLVRWTITLGKYDYVLKYIKGASNLLADTLSRLPMKEEVKNENVDVKKVHMLIDLDAARSDFQ